MLVNRISLRRAGRDLDRAPSGGSPQRKRARRQRLQLASLERLLRTPLTTLLRELPPLSAKVWSQSPTLRACAQSLSFLNLGAPRAAQRLEVADRYAPELAAVLEAGPHPQLRAALALADLLPELGRDLEPALLVLRGDAPRLARPGVPALERLEGRLKRITLRKPGLSPRPSSSEPELAPLLLARHFLELHALPRRERQRRARALAALPPFDHERRRSFWDREAALDRELRALEVQARHSRVGKLPLARLESRLRALRPDAPLAYLDAETLERCNELARDAGALELLLEHAQELPLASRQAWFSGWRPLLRDARRERALRAIPRVGRWLARGSRHPLSLRLHLLSRLETATGAGDVNLSRNLLALEAFLEAAGGLTNPHLPPALLWHAGLRAAAARREPGAAWGQALAELLLNRPSAWEDLEELGYGSCLVLAKVGGSNPAHLELLLARFLEADLQHSQERRLAEFAESLLRADPVRGRELAYEFMTHEPLRELARVGLGLEAYRELRGFSLPLAPPAPSLRVPTWARAYPRQLHPLLRALHATATRPWVAVSRTLKREFPGPLCIRGEIQALRRKIRAEGDRGGCYQRLQTLERRLETYSVPDPARVRRAERRLRDRLRRARLDHLQATLDDALQRAFAGEIPGFPRAWLADKVLRRHLLHAAVLVEEEIRPQAWRLLRRRLSDGPWDLRDLGPNRRFIRRLEARGLDLEPWLAGSQVSVYPAPGGCVVLSLENDPLEVLRMGDHFETCLSPGDINFYSAISNAVDVNKRVLYARDLEGRVVGRCLLALGDRGGLVAHHPYAHEAGLCFDRLASDYVRELAGRLGTEPVAGERISLLVSEEWYDDSPVDLCETEAFLRDSASEFRRSLATLEPAALGAHLERACGGPPSPRVVAGLLALPEFVERPELALGLWAWTRGLRAPARLSLAILTRRAGCPEAGARLLASLVRRPPRHGPELTSLAEELLLQGWAGPALRLIRRHGLAPELEARAREALGRPGKRPRTKNLKN